MLCHLCLLCFHNVVSSTFLSDGFIFLVLVSFCVREGRVAPASDKGSVRLVRPHRGLPDPPPRGHGALLAVPGLAGGPNPGVCHRSFLAPLALPRTFNLEQPALGRGKKSTSFWGFV